MLTNVASSVFTNSDSVGLVPIVSAEWNHNLFNPPYLTTAGLGVKQTVTLLESDGISSSVTENAKPNFTTRSLQMSNGKGYVKYSVTATGGFAYKIITYIKTNSPIPTMVTAFGEANNGGFGTAQDEANSLGWTKVITTVGSPGVNDTEISSITYTINFNDISGTDDSPLVYFTVPEVYQTEYLNYINDSLWPTDSPFQYFRPGESYISTGNANISLPSNYRKISTSIINSYTSAHYSPVSPIVQTSSFFLASPPVPGIKNSLATDIAPYKYYRSQPIDGTQYPSISGLYEKPIVANKIVIKFNTLITTPAISIRIDDSLLTVDGSSVISMPTNSDGFCTGVLTLYWNGTAWTKTKWSTMPKFLNTGSITNTTSFKKITVTQTSVTKRSQFDSYTNDNIDYDINGMHLVEVSPRLEVDLSSFVQSLSIEKSLDSQNSVLPISSVNSDTLSLKLSAIPLINSNQIVNIFSSQSDKSSTVLANILRKNIKLYVNFNLFQYSKLGSNPVTTPSYIPGGVFYSDSWEEEDINSVSVQGFDILRYLQSTPVPDYVANLKSVFEIITNILDLAGFTDYDYDSLYKVCNNKAVPMDISYFYCNSKDSTILDVLNKIFTAYQIGAYIDEYGIMKFLGLYEILSSTPSTITLNDYNIQQNGFSISNKAKPGKISLRYQAPKVKQSPSLQNVTNPAIQNSPSFVYTTSNDVVWQQQSIDSVGFNYLKDTMAKNDNVLKMNINDIQDIFHTYNRDANGYAFIENEIVSFLYKEYTISKSNGTSVTVSIKNNLELQSEINKFIKKYSVGLKTSDGQTKQDYDVIVSPTGNITNVQRGLFGTVPSEHKRITTLASKGLTAKQYTTTGSGSLSDGSSYVSIIDDHDNDSVLPSIDKISISSTLDNNSSESDKLLIFPENEVDNYYQTYSVKFEMPEQDLAGAGLFFNMNPSTPTDGTYFVELVRFNTKDSAGVLYDPPIYRYIITLTNGENAYWSEVTGECNSIVNNFAKIIKKTEVNNGYEYSYVTDNTFHLKVVTDVSTGEDGEVGSEQDPKTIVSVFLNNIEIIGWQEQKTNDYDPDTNPGGSGWKATDLNPVTGMRRKPYFSSSPQPATKFGFIADMTPAKPVDENSKIDYPLDGAKASPASLREIHATWTPLKERSVSYYYQTREFLNGLVQGQPLYSQYPTYIMQTTPEISGINYYDVQYTTPAAVSVDVLPIEYMWKYYPGNDQIDQLNFQKKLIDEYSLSYSTIINTGYRAKMAIANNSPNTVFLHKEADSLNDFTINLNLWTHEIVAPSDPEILEQVIDQGNISEVAQLDSEWVQSKESALRMLKVISLGIEGFSKTITLNIFGNPLMQVGDIVTLTYALNGISNQRYVVTGVTHSFDQGFTTVLTLNRLQ